ncbi:MAG: Ktr system potassium transporter B [Rhizobiales bacterium]|nr:Ktr system potassium transporter B [Hyphomicrobiales bacterium]
MLMALYAVLVLLGSAFLMLPVASTRPITWSDALFTAMSSVTVTGLVVIDTGSVLTAFGQAIIVILIQLGGLGLMTFAVFVLSALGQQVGITHQLVLRADLDRTSIGDLLSLVRTIILVVFVCELIGALVLALVFVPQFGWQHGLWSAVFHAISAFNNAGFSLYPDSLTAFADNPIINLAVPAMFIIGGLGYAVLAELIARKPWRRFSLHSKLMLTGTAFLIVLSVVLFALLEWRNPRTLGGEESLAAKLWISWFQGVTTRTAGFNTIDIAGMHESTAFLFILLMFIGGGSTSTAGGIKVTSAIVLILATIAFLRRSQSLVAFSRRIDLDEVLKVMALATIGAFFIAIGTFVLVASRDGVFLDSLFEVVSAFGTVGLSRGLTAELDSLQRGVIMVIMFFGRVGPLTLGFFMATRTPPRIRYPRGEIYLG